MRVELLVVPDCPNEKRAAELLRQALDEAGFDDVTFETIIVTTREQAHARGFTGSPAFLLDGQDAFAAPGAAPAVACRVYQTAKGPAGTPDLADLVTCLHRVPNRSRAERDEPGDFANLMRRGHRHARERPQVTALR